MKIFYLACLIITLFFLLWYINVGEKRGTHQNLLLMIIVVANGGYYALACAENLREAVLANKIIYLSGCFVPMLSFLAVCEICKVKLKNYIVVGMYIVQIITYAAVCTIGYSDLYYKTVEFKLENGIGTLVKTYGPLHNLYIITMFGYMIASMVVAFLAVFRRTIVSYRTAIYVLVCFIITVAGYSLERLLKVKVELMPIFFLFMTMIVLFPFHNMNAYSISENIRKVYQNKEKSGFMTFDKKLRFMGCNDLMVELYPEIADFYIDKQIDTKEGKFVKQVMPLLERYAYKGKETNVTVEINDKKYHIEIDPILRNNKKRAGYLIEFEDVTTRQKYLEMVRNYNKDLELEVYQKTQKIQDIQEKTVIGMAMMVESRDLSTGGHIKRTSDVVGLFSDEILKAKPGIKPEFLKMVTRSAPMHDLGKITVDDKVLRKQGKFTDEEYAQMKKHAAAGAEIVYKILTGIEDERFVEIATNVAHYHHEKYDGSGYPEHLKGEEIPLEARIMALADVFDALVSKRCYKEAYSYDKAFSIIEESAGGHFDAELTEIFLKCRPKLEELYNSYKDE